MTAVEPTTALEPQDSGRLLDSFMPGGGLPADGLASLVAEATGDGWRAAAAQPVGTRVLDLPDYDEMTDIFCWNRTEGLTSGNARRQDGQPPCPDFNPSNKKTVLMSVWRDDDLARHLAFQADKIKKEGRIALDWRSADHGDVPWCPSEEDLVRQALALLREPYVLEAIDLLICMFVTVRGSGGSPATPEQQAARHCEVSKRIRELLGLQPSADAFSACTPALGGGLTPVNTQTGEIGKALSIGKSTTDKQPIAGADVQSDVAALVVSENPARVLLVGAPSMPLRVSQSLFAGLGSEGASSKSKMCAVVAMARLLFHELLHLACVIAVPEATTAEPCGANTGHSGKKNNENECDVVDMLSTAFNYVLDQVFESQPPAYADVKECKTMKGLESDVGFSQLPDRGARREYPIASSVVVSSASLLRSNPCVEAQAEWVEWDGIPESGTRRPDVLDEEKFREPTIDDAAEGRLPSTEPHSWLGPELEVPQGRP